MLRSYLIRQEIKLSNISQSTGFSVRHRVQDPRPGPTQGGDSKRRTLVYRAGFLSARVTEKHTKADSTQRTANRDAACSLVSEKFIHKLPSHQFVAWLQTFWMD